MARQRYRLMEFASISRPVLKGFASYARAFLYSESDNNDLSYFPLHPLVIVQRSLDGLEKYLGRKLSEQQRVERLLNGPDVSGRALNHRQLAVVLRAQRDPYSRFTIESHRRSPNVTYQTTRSDLLRLADAGLLERRKTGRALVYLVPHDLESRIRRALKGPR